MHYYDSPPSIGFGTAVSRRLPAAAPGIGGKRKPTVTLIVASRWMCAAALAVMGALTAPAASAGPVFDPFNGNGGFEEWKGQLGGGWQYGYWGPPGSPTSSGGYIVKAPESAATVSSFAMPLLEFNPHGPFTPVNRRHFVAKWDSATRQMGPLLYMSEKFKIGDSPLIGPIVDWPDNPLRGWRMVTAETGSIDLTAGAEYTFGWTAFAAEQDPPKGVDWGARMNVGVIPVQPGFGYDPISDLVWTGDNIFAPGAQWASRQIAGVPMQITWDPSSPVPEPGTLGLMAAGLIALVFAGRRSIEVAAAGSGGSPQPANGSPPVQPTAE